VNAPNQQSDPTDPASVEDVESSTGADRAISDAAVAGARSGPLAGVALALGALGVMILALLRRRRRDEETTEIEWR
jgi:hypothetical protein